MRVRLASFQGLCFMVLLGFVLALSAIAQDKAPTKGTNIQGTVMAIKKDTSTITVDTSNLTSSKTPRQVNYSASTTFLYGHSTDNKPGTLDKVQMGYYISCKGAVEKGVLTATECVYRETK